MDKVRFLNFGASMAAVIVTFVLQKLLRRHSEALSVSWVE